MYFSYFFLPDTHFNDGHDYDFFVYFNYCVCWKIKLEPLSVINATTNNNMLKFLAETQVGFISSDNDILAHSLLNICHL